MLALLLLLRLAASIPLVGALLAQSEQIRLPTNRPRRSEFLRVLRRMLDIRKERLDQRVEDDLRPLRPRQHREAHLRQLERMHLRLARPDPRH